MAENENTSTAPGENADPGNAKATTVGSPSESAKNSMPAGNAQIGNQQPGVNPVAASMQINLFLPEVLEIRLVEACTLEDYEFWFFVSGLLFAVFIGFAVEFYHSLKEAPHDAESFWIAAVFLALFVATVLRAKFLREQLRAKSKPIKMAVVPLP